MHIYKVNNSEVIECKHCNGTGICANSKYRYNQHNNPYVSVCQNCGSGLESQPYQQMGQDGYYHTVIDRPAPPVCRVCNGTGFNRV
jgi:hypothetical protein